MKRLLKKTTRAAIPLFLLFVAAAVSPYPGTPGFDIVGTYYSDYFTTQVGEYHDYCDGTYESEGTLDGQTFEWTKTNCNFGGVVTRCYQKIDGVWTQVTCP
jgi:hypothetical protein